MTNDLPPAITLGARLAGNEYGWPISAFPAALDNAEKLRYACLGGQFQFRVDSGIREMYWLGADSDTRKQCEAWIDYCMRSNTEVKAGFERLVSSTDFVKQALDFSSMKEEIAKGIDLMSDLVFVAYFVNETEWLSDQHSTN